MTKAKERHDEEADFDAELKRLLQRGDNKAADDLVYQYKEKTEEQ